jgi:pimeloyl-ACP methyl ester carboxylesterase
MAAMTRVPSSNGVQVAVHDLGGPAAGRALLLCHATGFHGMVWRAVAAALPDRRCLALDFRGFGDSTPPADGDFDWHGFGDDVLAVVDHLGLTDVQAVGHSKGGAALLIAEQARPGTFERLVCFEPIVMPAGGEGAQSVPTGGEHPMAATARRRRDSFDTFEEAIERYAGKQPIGSLRRDVLEDYVRYGFRPTDDGRVTLKATPEHEARTYEHGHRHGAFERLGEVRCPVLVAHGGDGGMPALLAPMIVEALPAGQELAFPDLGHFGPLEDPEAFAAAVREFLGAP